MAVVREFRIFLCFECGAMEFFDGDKSIGSTGIGSSPGDLDSILLQAGVPLVDR
ncbi:MAG: hypothetical protein JWL59_1586 [Chthoniobacteraceae bacterium]|nr:hypothetical protein [Chthoniobacteraceae bacterium]